ncbi:15-hydroxyprostaglandin dehydrogenase [NAD(+)]-like [Anoplopoma fimbria]|uniref:15-hydroxyprostaglandin dehydrogenase [NAD(+)]-like n=1 Tax=Anoplopoma fimbria TaxID=229290 RepID=UPI0023EC1C3E|nr:15-hydroxyprostaglandin dehydrogenase [NAD(+)]-like [Anoplopoma fimbria]
MDVALLDVNESAGKSLEEALNKQYGQQRTLFLNCKAASTGAGYGIRFNALCPAFVQTDLFSNIYDRMGQFSQLAAETRVFVDKGVLNPSEVAEGLLELVTNETKNGEAFMVKCNVKKYMTFPDLS